MRLLVATGHWLSPRNDDYHKHIGSADCTPTINLLPLTKFKPISLMKWSSPSSAYAPSIEDAIEFEMTTSTVGEPGYTADGDDANVEFRDDDDDKRNGNGDSVGKNSTVNNIVFKIGNVQGSPVSSVVTVQDSQSRQL